MADETGSQGGRRARPRGLERPDRVRVEPQPHERESLLAAGAAKPERRTRRHRRAKALRHGWRALKPRATVGGGLKPCATVGGGCPVALVAQAFRPASGKARALLQQERPSHLEATLSLYTATERLGPGRLAMRHNGSVSAAVLLVTMFWCGGAQAQSDIPRTASGTPDLNGIWDFHHLTPLQRPREFSGKTTLSDEQAAVYESNAFNRVRDQRARGANFVGVDLWHEEALAEWTLDNNRTSLITDPADGRVPPLTERRQAELSAVTRFRGRPRSAEDRSLAERCLIAPQSVPPIMTLIENAMLQIFQTPDHVVIHTERMHDSRIVPLDGRPLLPGRMTPYMGSSVGHWEGIRLSLKPARLTRDTVSSDPAKRCRSWRDLPASVAMSCATNSRSTTRGVLPSPGRPGTTCNGRTVRSSNTPAMKVTMGSPTS